MASDETGVADAERRRLRWRCRRGAKELDLLLTRYLESDYPAASGSEQSAFADLLECQDPDLLDWLMGRTANYPPQCEAVIRRLRSYSD